MKILIILKLEILIIPILDTSISKTEDTSISKTEHIDNTKNEDNDEDIDKDRNTLIQMFRYSKQWKDKKGNRKRRQIVWVFWNNGHVSELCEKMDMH